MPGFFDIVRCHYPLPNAEYQRCEFQTKDFGQQMAQFTITAEGRLLRSERTLALLSNDAWDPKGRRTNARPALSTFRRRKREQAMDVNHHGDVRIYLTNDKKEFVQYVVRFTHGRVESIHRMEASSDTLDPPSLALLAEIVETAAWAHVNVLTQCFAQLAQIDPTLAARAIETLSDEAKAARWFAEAQRGLSGKSPYEALASGRREEIIRIFNAIEHGLPT